MANPDYTADFTAFFRDLFPVEGVYGPKPVIPPFLASWLKFCFPSPEGHPAARNVLDSRSKKQGKSALGGAVALYMASRARYSEVVIAAADKDQAKDRVLKAVKFAVNNNPVWSKAKIYRDVIELDQGSVITAIPFDWRGASGGNYAAVIFDELHVFTWEDHRRLFDELIIPPTQPNGVRWIASYAGFLGESEVLQDWWDRALAGKRIDADLPIYHNQAASLLGMIDQGEASWRMPWTTPEYMSEVREGERPNTYRRLWLNEWVANESQFVSREAWQECYNPELYPLQPGDDRMVVLGADASTTRDLTALVGTTWNEQDKTVDVIYTRVWTPQPGINGKPTIDLSGLRAEILRLKKAYNLAAVIYDPYQLHSIAGDLRNAGVNMIEHPQTAQRIEADQALYDAVIGRTIRHYGDPTLTEHILNSVAVESPRGFRLDKAKTTRKIDAAVSLSMAHHKAWDYCTPWDVF